jgi:hypothetical protein
MSTKTAVCIVLVSLACSGLVSAAADPLTSFKDFYDQMGSGLATKPPAELAEISNFVYEKDVATFTFTSGSMYLLRNADGRPTTAIFVGQGHAKIDIPSHTERVSMFYAAGDSVVDVNFENAMFNFSDDFDLRLKEKFTFQRTELPWKDFNKTQQGEFYFQPVVMHTYDNYFQLIRSLFERKADGYFWADFGRYGFTFDPNRPEEVLVGYEHEGADQEMTIGAQMQRREKGVYDDFRMSDLSYTTTALGCVGTMEMKGMDGQVIDKADVTMKVLLNADSLRFVSLFLHYNLKLDSLYVDGAASLFKRRNDFVFIGVILPEYRHKGDTLTFRLWYHGKDYQSALPFVENPTPAPVEITIDAPKGYGYVAPGIMPAEATDSKRERFLSAPQEPYRVYQMQPYASGYDTIPAVSDIGLTVNFLKSSSINKNKFGDFIPDEYYRTTVMGAFNFMTGRFGPPVGTFVVWVYPDSNRSLPGLMSVPQVMALVDGTGGLPMVAGNAAARQWFGTLMQPKTDREFWWLDAIPDYLSLAYVSEASGPSIFFGELLKRRNGLFTIMSNNEHWPLAAGARVDGPNRVLKGIWVLHMLRYLMYDLSTHSEQKFFSFLNDFKTLATSRVFSNEDVMKLAEKHYGASLDWFFEQWVYERDVPQYKVTYAVEKRTDGYYVGADVAVGGVSNQFRMPVIVRIEDTKGNSTYHRPEIAGAFTHFELGPFADEPSQVIFNEFVSVLSKDDVKKK